jgi:hypothetical protein
VIGSRSSWYHYEEECQHSRGGLSPMLTNASLGLS